MERSGLSYSAGPEYNGGASRRNIPPPPVGVAPPPPRPKRYEELLQKEDTALLTSNPSADGLVKKKREARSFTGLPLDEVGEYDTNDRSDAAEPVVDGESSVRKTWASNSSPPVARPREVHSLQIKPSSLGPSSADSSMKSPRSQGAQVLQFPSGQSPISISPRSQYYGISSSVNNHSQNPDNSSYNSNSTNINFSSPPTIKPPSPPSNVTKTNFVSEPILHPHHAQLDHVQQPMTIRRMSSMLADAKPLTKKQIKAEEEYQRYLELSKQADFSKIEPLNIIYVSGHDSEGRPIVIAIAANLPAKRIDMDALLLYGIHVLDPVVENDYVLIFVNSNVSSENRPSFAWLKKAYGVFNRKYKKNLKALHIVHANLWIKMIMRMAKPFISTKFWRKLTMLDDITELYKHIDREQLYFPDHVMKHNAKINARKPVFGTPLAEVLDIEHSISGVPEVMEKSISYLKNYYNLEGIFRLSGGHCQIEELKQAFNRGEDVDLSTCDDPHAVAGLVKLFLRELPDPLIPYDMYDNFVETQRAMGSEHQQMWLSTMKSLLNTLPAVNFRCMKILLEMMNEVSKLSDQNKMNSGNLAIVFAPNIFKKREETMQQVMLDTPIINSMMKSLIESHPNLF